MLMKAENLKKEFADKIVFENVTFSVSPGDRIGIIGVDSPAYLGRQRDGRRWYDASPE